MATKKAPAAARTRTPATAGAKKVVSKPTTPTKSTAGTTTAGGRTQYDVQLTTAGGGSKVVQGTLGKTPAQRAKSANILSKVAGDVSSSNVGGLLRGSGVSAPKQSTRTAKKPSGPAGRALGGEPLAPPAAASGIRPSSVTRGTTASLAAKKAIATAGRGTQSVSRVTAKGGKKSSKGRTVRF